jgi:hypothetical protein
MSLIDRGGQRHDRDPDGWHRHSGRTDDLACRIARSDRWAALNRVLLPAAVATGFGVLAWLWGQFDGLRLGMAELNTKVSLVLDAHEKRLDKIEERTYPRRAEAGK